MKKLKATVPSWKPESSFSSSLRSRESIAKRAKAESSVGNCQRSRHFLQLVEIAERVGIVEQLGIVEEEDDRSYSFLPQ